MLNSIIFTEKKNILLKPNLFVSKLIINCNSDSFLCLVSLKLLFKMQTLRSLMLWSSALKCNRSGRSFFCLIECVWLLNLYLKLPPVSPVYSASGHFSKWIKYTTLAESQIWLPGLTVLWLINTLVAVLMCLQILHLCLPHGLLHSGSLSVMVFLIRRLRRFGSVYWSSKQRYLQSSHHLSECCN